MTFVRDYNISNIEDMSEEYLCSEVLNDDWTLSEKYGDTIGWLHKPIYRVVEIVHGFLVFSECEERVFVGITSSKEEANLLGEKSV